MLRVVLALAGAFFAALFAHGTIDVAGDYVLAHDTYDDDAHGSRYVASIALLATVLVALFVYVRAVMVETRGVRGALHAAVRASIPDSPYAFVVHVAGLAFPMLLGMAWLDSLVAGVPVDDVADLFGGSLVLGIVTTAIASFATAFGILAIVFLIARFHRSIVRVACALVHATFPRMATDACLVVRRTDDRACVSAVVGRCNCADRAPPVAPIRVRIA